MAGHDDEPKTQTNPEGSSGDEGRGYGGQPPIVASEQLFADDEGDKSSGGSNLARRLRAARRARNLISSTRPDATFAETYLDAVRSGSIPPNLGALERLAERLHINVADILRLNMSGTQIADLMEQSFADETPDDSSETTSPETPDTPDASNEDQPPTTDEENE